MAASRSSNIAVIHLHKQEDLFLNTSPAFLPNKQESNPREGKSSFHGAQEANSSLARHACLPHVTGTIKKHNARPLLLLLRER
ncbi:hypothetical protein JTE90_024220 [Oedothorax gibbosus]|uniref:Uncharacterized protein n=1 Tax=Oedothorax gibbosus TaxID=931172 RepID=A0AAV6U9X7_9ARAC|nr:hypothetical protein JTE90_024220 [Oedothorax gibbosus]